MPPPIHAQLWSNQGGAVHRNLILSFLLMLSLVWGLDVYGTPVTINSNTTWDILNHPSNLLPNYDYREGITVTNGAILTISGLTNLQMNSNSIILVSNGDLIITNSIIFMGDYSLIRLLGILGTPHSLTMTNSKLKPSGTNWAGIELLQTYWHGTTKIQYLTYPTIDPNGNCSNSQWTGVIYPNIGKVNIENSEIYDAEIGINCAPNTYYGGGVVRVRNSKFYNCKKGIRISDFYDNDYPNASYIMTCDFEWNDNLTFPTSNLAHIELEELYTGALNIGGCNFYNYKNNIDYASERGIGINSIKSNFSISKDGDKCCVGQDGKCPDNCFTNPLTTQRSNNFINLGYGIKFYGSNSGNLAEKIACRYSNFTNCANSIYIENALDVVVSDNKFEISSATYDDFFPNTFLNNIEIFDNTFINSSGVRIFDNEYKHDLEYIVSIKSASPDQSQTSFIRHNTFNNTAGLGPLCGPHIIAIDLFNNNNHLDITCNSFIDQVYDIKVEEDASLDDIPNMEVNSTIKKYSRNTFSVLPPCTSSPVYPCNEQTNGCSSNIFNETSSTEVNLRIVSQSFDGMRFHYLSHPNITYIHPSPQCDHPNIKNSDCVDCETTCNKLGIMKTSNLKVKKFLIKDFFSFYPNPTKNNVTIELINNTWNENAYLKIYDFQGQLIYDVALLDKVLSINLKELKIKSGVYCVVIQTDFKTAYSKLILQ
ncbi:MAG: T9SS type A sorting domain-containing protein [Bacteroidia bacterium]|nr:T9SS type A sorting domain-containing protein [Bacteroidia bacterium]